MWTATAVSRAGPACSDCVISVLIGAPGATVDLDPAEQAALSALADSGLVPPLRLIPGSPSGSRRPGSPQLVRSTPRDARTPDRVCQ